MPYLITFPIATNGASLPASSGFWVAEFPGDRKNTAENYVGRQKSLE